MDNNISPNINNNTLSPPIQFPVITHDHLRDERRTTVDERDFFSQLNDQLLENDLDGTNGMGSSGPSFSKLDVKAGLGLQTANTSSDQSTVEDGVSPISKDKTIKRKLAVFQAELERINTENQQLKKMLDQMSDNYNDLQMHLVTLAQDQRAENGEEVGNMVDKKVEDHRKKDTCNFHRLKGGGLIVPRQFMDLGPANSTCDNKIDHERSNSSDARCHDGSGSFNKNARLNPSKDEVEAATEAMMRKARVSVKARFEALMITDGCQWKLHGKTTAKGNSWPCFYYRCTMDGGCLVRKQVQRCAEDGTISITTYDGNHNHPLPPAAMAMASLTSAAARMLLSGSKPSADGIMNSNLFATNVLPCSSNMATIWASDPFPTVSLDLTQNPNPLRVQRNQFQAPFPNQPQNVGFNASLLPQYAGQPLYNQSKFSGLQMSNSFADAVSAAIAVDPQFTVALTVAFTSIIGGSQLNNENTTTTNNTINGISNSVTRLKQRCRRKRSFF